MPPATLECGKNQGISRIVPRRKTRSLHLRPAQSLSLWPIPGSGAWKASIAYASPRGCIVHPRATFSMMHMSQGGEQDYESDATEHPLIAVHITRDRKAHAMATKPTRVIAQDASTTAGSAASAPVTTARGAAPHLTVEERRAQGRALREKTPRTSHAFVGEAPDRPDPVALLEAQAATRLPDLIPLRYARMSVSPLAFLRGAATVMAHDLAQTPTTGIQTQLCGDCHLANFGLYASPERTLLFDINDLDETHPGPWEWDVKRLAASIFVAGRGNGFTDPESRNAVIAAVRSYRLRMAEFADMRNLDVWYSRVTVDDLLNLIANKQDKKLAEKQVAKVRQRDSLQARGKLTELVDGHRVFVNDPPLVVRATEEMLGAEVRSLFDKYMESLRGAQRQMLDRFHIVDVARKVVGVGSVGTRCFIGLLTGRDDNDPLILQVKEAEASVLEAHLQPSVYAHHGERVVRGQELMQAASDIFLGWMSGPGGRHFYWRQLRDMKGSIVVENLTSANLALYAGLCGWALARGHARSSGNAIEIASYLGTNDRFDQAVASFAEAYANQTERDYQALLSAIKSGRLAAAVQP